MPKTLSESGGASTQIILRVPPELHAQLLALQADLTTEALGAPRWSTVVRRCLEVGCQRLGEAAKVKREAKLVASKPTTKKKAQKRKASEQIREMRERPVPHVASDPPFTPEQETETLAGAVEYVVSQDDGPSEIAAPIPSAPTCVDPTNCNGHCSGCEATT